jgi:hypothetical protein
MYYCGVNDIFSRFISLSQRNLVDSMGIVVRVVHAVTKPKRSFRETRGNNLNWTTKQRRRPRRKVSNKWHKTLRQQWLTFVYLRG